MHFRTGDERGSDRQADPLYGSFYNVETGRARDGCVLYERRFAFCDSPSYLFAEFVGRKDQIGLRNKFSETSRSLPPHTPCKAFSCPHTYVCGWGGLHAANVKRELPFCSRVLAD